MPILVVWASPNEDGLTASAKEQIVKGIKAVDGEAEILNLNKCNLEHCLTCGNGWGKCQSDGQCIISDDFSDIYSKLVAADGIVWITPVYWHDLSECLKYFLDRLRRCETHHNHYLQKKECLLIACAGGTGRGAIQCLHNLEETLNHMGMTAVDRLPIIRFNQSYMLPSLFNSGQSFASYLL
jgi:multimeric flavodoxin WrbA